MTFREVPTLAGPRVSLRPIRESDPEELLSIPRDSEYIRLNGGDLSQSNVRTREDVTNWYNSRADSLRWVIEIDGGVGGELRFDHYSEDRRYATLAIGIYEPKNRDKGYGSEAIQLALGYAFDGLRLHLVELYVLDFNARARRAYAKCGFREDGLLRDRVLIDGEWHSDVVMSIREDEWRKLAGVSPS